MNLAFVALALISQTPVAPALDAERTFEGGSEQRFRHAEVVYPYVYFGGASNVLNWDTSPATLPFNTTRVGPGVSAPTNADDVYIVRLDLSLTSSTGDRGIVFGSGCSDRAAYQIKPRGDGSLDVCGMTHDGDSLPGIASSGVYQSSSQKGPGCGSIIWNAWNSNHGDGYCVVVANDLSSVSGGTLWGGSWGESTARLQMVQLSNGNRLTLTHTNENSFDDLVGPQPYHSGGADREDGVVMEWFADNSGLARSFYLPRGGSNTIEFPGGLVELPNGDWLLSTTVGLQGQSGTYRIIRYRPSTNSEVWSFDVVGQAMAESGAALLPNGNVVFVAADLDPNGEDFNGCRLVAVDPEAAPANRLVWDTIIDGNGNDMCYKPVALPDNSVIVVGRTSSTNLPVTDGLNGTIAALDTSLGGGLDGTIIWLNADGSARYISYHGTNELDMHRGAAFYDDFLYVAGWRVINGSNDEGESAALAMRFGPLFTTPPPQDAGVSDAGFADAGFPDSGVEPDAGFPDAGFPDSGVVPDAGTPDAGFPLCYSSVSELCAAAATVCN